MASIVFVAWSRRPRKSNVSAMSAVHTVIVGDGQGWRQFGELALAFALSSVIGLERQYRGKSAGLRTQAIVGTTAALVLLVSKFGFSDVLGADSVVLDPSRVAAQIVSGIGFLGAGLIITRQGAIRGLTTAAAVWETAAIGMAAGAGLAWLALFVTALHFVTVFGLAPLGKMVSAWGHAERRYSIGYQDGRGVLRELLALCAVRSWTVTSLVVSGGRPDSTHGDDEPPLGELVTVALTLSGPRADDAVPWLGSVDGVLRVDRDDADDD